MIFLKKAILIALIVLLLLAAYLLIPTKTTFLYTGEAEILSRERQPIGTHPISIQITDLAARFFSYRTSFTLRLDGMEWSADEMEGIDRKTLNGFCIVNEIFFLKDDGAFHSAHLLYPQDFSYLELTADEQTFFVRNGSDVPYSEIGLIPAS